VIAVIKNALEEIFQSTLRKAKVVVFGN